MNNRLASLGLYGLCTLLTALAHADGVVIDRIYHPYVEAMTREIEWRVLYQDNQIDQQNHQQRHQLAYGQALNDRWFGEVYLVGDKFPGEGFDLEAIELELIHQLTEQGESWADWGILLEVEKGIGQHLWEAAGGILMEKELGPISVTGNFKLGYEWGDDIEDEIETLMAVQLRHRWRRGFEPAVEFHGGEDTLAVGTVAMGEIVTGIRRQVHWELGYFWGLDNASPDHSIRASIEYEY